CRLPGRLPGRGPRPGERGKSLRCRGRRSERAEEPQDTCDSETTTSRPLLTWSFPVVFEVEVELVVPPLDLGPQVGGRDARVLFRADRRRQRRPGFDWHAGLLLDRHDHDLVRTQYRAVVGPKRL